MWKQALIVAIATLAGWIGKVLYSYFRKPKAKKVEKEETEETET